MAKSISEYTAEISKSYDNSRNALQNQINAIAGDLAQTQKQINENYDSQQSNLNDQQNWAAQSASMAASRNGGSFGGASEIANKKYYEQTFVPAQTRLNTSRSQALENAQAQANSNKLALEQQLAGMNDEISRLGIQRYYDELEREREEAYRQQQLALQREQNALAKYASSSTSSESKSNGTYGRGYNFAGNNDGNGWYFTDANGNYITAQQYANNNGRDVRDFLHEMADAGDLNSKRALAGLGNAARQLTREEEIAFDVLGINRSGWGSRA